MQQHYINFIGQGLSILTEGSIPHLERELRKAFGDQWPSEVFQAFSLTRAQMDGIGKPKWDAPLVLKTLDRWSEKAFKKTAAESKHLKGTITRLLAIRNDWAHQRHENFDQENTRRALDDVMLILESIRSPMLMDIRQLRDQVVAGPRSSTRQVSYDQSFTSELNALPDEVRLDLIRKLETLSSNPTDHPDAFRLLLTEGVWVLQVGEYRVVYHLDPEHINLRSVLHRNEVYEKLGLPDEDPTPKKKTKSSKTPKTNHAADSDLPHPLTPELLASWRVPQDCIFTLANCKTEMELLEAAENKVPYKVFTLVVDLLYSKRWRERLAQPSYLIPKPRDLDDLVAGKLTSELLKLDNHQRQVALTDLENPRAPIVVLGSPGSGKSTVALYRVKHLRERYPDARILYTTYTNALVNASREQLDVLLPEVDDNIQVKTLDSMALGVVKPLGITANDTIDATKPICFETLQELSNIRDRLLSKYSDRYLLQEFFQVIEQENCTTEEQYLKAQRRHRSTRLSANVRKAIWKLYEAFKTSLKKKNSAFITFTEIRQKALQHLLDHPSTAEYDFVLVDETQDLDEVGLRLVKALCKTPTGLYFTADPNQTLYHNLFAFDSMQEDWPEAVVLKLERNYRNTREILQAAHDVRQGMAEVDEDIEALENLRSGQRPRLIRKHDALEALLEEIRHIRKRHRIPLQNIAVLVAGDQKQAFSRGKAIQSHLQSHRFKANYMGSKDLKLDAECIKILSMHTSKGLEFPAVVIMDVHEGILPRDVSELPPEERIEEEMRDRRLLYVACTRAMQSLSVVVSDQEASTFIDDLQDDHWEMM